MRKCVLTGAILLCAAAFGQTAGIQTVSEVESRKQSADLDAFNAQKDTGYKTFYQYLWHICAAEIDG